MQLKKIFRTAAVGTVNTLDPARIDTIAEKMLVSNLVDTLFQRNVDTGEIIPRACERYEVSSDGLKWRFFLRKDLFWSNGKRIRAKDFEAAIRRLLKPQTKARVAKKLESIAGAREVLDGAFYNPENVGVSSMDLFKQSVLDITLTKPDSMLMETLSLTALAPIPSEDYELHPDEVFSPSSYIASGSFVIARKSPTSFVLTKNPHHRYSPSIQLDEVQFFTLQKTSEGEQMFLSGLLDEFGYPDLPISDETLAQLSGTGYLIFQPDMRLIFVRLSANQSPFNQFPFRQALAMTINPQDLIESIGLEGEKKAQSLIPDSIKYYDAPHGYYFNPTAGMEMLTNLGYCNPKGCGLIPKMTLTYADTSAMKKIALQFAAHLKQSLGTNQIQLKPLDVDVFLRSVEKGDYAMALDEIATEGDAFSLLHSFVTGNPLSGGYSNPAYDQLIQQAYSSPTSVDRMKYYREAESLLLRDIAVIPLMFKSTPILLHKRVKGFTPNIWNIHPFESLSLK